MAEGKTIRCRMRRSGISSVRPRSMKSRGTDFTLSMTSSTCWKKVPMKMIRNFCASPVPGPQDGQRHEGDHRHVADEVDERLDRRLPAPIAADQDADRQRDRGRDQEADADPVDADADIGGELARRPRSSPSRRQHLRRARAGRAAAPGRPR